MNKKWTFLALLFPLLAHAGPGKSFTPKIQDLEQAIGIEAETCGLVLGKEGHVSAATGENFAEWKDSDRSFRKILRSNSLHWVEFFKSFGHVWFNESDLKLKGYSAVDPHTGNFTPIYQGPGQGLAYALIDIDDGGEIPLLMDIARNISVASVAAPDLDIEKVFRAYMDGLNGEAVHRNYVPDEVLRATGREPERVERDLTSFAKKRARISSKGKTKLDNSSVDGTSIKKYLEENPEESYLERDEAEIVNELQVRGFGVLDTAIRFKEGGGSGGLPRLVVLVESPEGKLRLFEAKQQSEPGASRFIVQQGHSNRVKNLLLYFWPEALRKSPYYGMIETSEGNSYWLNVRHKNYIDHQDVPDRKSELKLYEALVVYNSYQLGLAHAKQDFDKIYLEYVREESDRILEAISDMLVSYHNWVFDRL